jgi:hypothetical protein
MSRGIRFSSPRLPFTLSWRVSYRQSSSRINQLAHRQISWKGRPFDFPPFAVDANVQHIHVNLHFQLTWSARQENYNRTSDHYLIYTEHMWDSGRFLLMGLITPAHERMPARDTRLLSYFSEVAEDFHAS